MSKELLKVKPCNCGHQWCIPFASRPCLFGIFPFPITIMCLACNKKITRFTKKSAVKRWNKINKSSRSGGGKTATEREGNNEFI